MHPVAEALKSTRVLIEMGWTQGKYAATIDGNPCDPTDAEARMFCLAGGIQIASMDIDVNWATRDFLTTRLGMPVENWNDAPGRTQKQVLNMLDSAFVEAKKLPSIEELAPRPPLLYQYMAVLKKMSGTPYCLMDTDTKLAPEQIAALKR